MNLTSDYPFWGISNGLIASYPTLHEDLRCDCVVVGGGITGALVGYQLAEAGVDTVVLDRRDIGTGSTSGSTGLLQYEVDVPLRELIPKVGKDAANRSYLLCREAIYKIEMLAKTHRISCGFVKKPSLQLARHQNETAAITQEYQLRRKLGIDLSLWSEGEIRRHFPFSRPMALFSENGAHVDPHSLTHGLMAAGIKRGLRIFDRTKIKRITHQRNGVVLKTETGLTIRARRAVIACGFESKQFLKSGAGSLKSTYALISEPQEKIPGWFRESLIWETGLPYLYLRTLPDRRIIVGGEDEPFVNPTRRDELISAKSRTLLGKFNRLFPNVKLDVAYSWAGTFGETKDGLPYIGIHKSRPHTYFALGYGGNGITYSLIAGEIIRNDFLGRRNPDAGIFAFQR